MYVVNKHAGNITLVPCMLEPPFSSLTPLFSPLPFLPPFTFSPPPRTQVENAVEKQLKVYQDRYKQQLRVSKPYPLSTHHVCVVCT